LSAETKRPSEAQDHLLRERDIERLLESLNALETHIKQSSMVWKSAFAG